MITAAVPKNLPQSLSLLILAALLSTNNVNAAYLDLKVTSDTPGVLGKTLTLAQYPGCSMGWDSGIDSSYLQSPAPAIDMPIINSAVGFELKEDARNPGNTEPYELLISGRALSSSVIGGLRVTAFDNGDGAFNGLSFSAQVFDSGDNLLGSFDPFAYFSTGQTFILPNIHNGFSYKVVVTPAVPEPATACIGALAAALEVRRKRKVKP